MKISKSKSLLVKSLVFAVLMSLFFSVPVYAENNKTQIASPFMAEAVENFAFDGKLYVFKYSLDKNGNKSIEIDENSAEAVYVLTFIDQDDGSVIVLLDGCEVGWIGSSTYIASGESASPLTRDGWVLDGSYTRPVHWTAGLAAAVVAGIVIGAITSSVPPLAAAILSAVVGWLAGGVIGGTITGSTYVWKPITIPMNLLYNFTLYASTGKTFGPYSYVITY